LPLWEKAQAEILDSLGKKRWAALLDELEAVKSSIQPRSSG